MASDKNSRRLRWALLMALALHLLLAWRYAPNLRARVEQAFAAEPEVVEKVMEISPEPVAPEPPRERWAMQTKLSGGSPEALPPPLPDDFFPRPKPSPGGRLELSSKLAQPPPRAADPAPTAQATAPVVPAVVRLPNIVAVSPQPRTPKPTAQAAPKPAPVVTAVQVAPEPKLAPPPLLARPPEDDPALDVAITRAAEAAERNARSEPAPRPPVDLRKLLPQGPIAQTPLRLPDGTRPAPPPVTPGITTYPLDAPVAPDETRAAPDEGVADQAPNRAQYFATLTAQLKATNQRVLADSVKAGPRVTVRMKFVVDRQGRLLEVYPVEGSGDALSQRAADIIRQAAPFPRIPEAMIQAKLELSFPVEVYR